MQINKQVNKYPQILITMCTNVSLYSGHIHLKKHKTPQKRTHFSSIREIMDIFFLKLEQKLPGYFQVWYFYTIFGLTCYLQSSYLCFWFLLRLWEDYTPYTWDVLLPVFGGVWSGERVHRSHSEIGSFSLVSLCLHQVERKKILHGKFTLNY